MSDDYERYGNALNPTSEQARNRRERREAQNVRAQANRLAQENAHLRALVAAKVTSAERCHPCPGISCIECDGGHPSVPHAAFVGVYRASAPAEGLRDHETCVPHDHVEPDDAKWERDQADHAMDCEARYNDWQGPCTCGFDSPAKAEDDPWRPCPTHGADCPAQRAAKLHRLLMPPHPGGVYASSALCSCGEWQFDSGSFGALTNEYRLILQVHTEHILAAGKPER